MLMLIYIALAGTGLVVVIARSPLVRAISIGLNQCAEAAAQPAAD